MEEYQLRLDYRLKQFLAKHQTIELFKNELFDNVIAAHERAYPHEDAEVIHQTIMRNGTNAYWQGMDQKWRKACEKFEKSKKMLKLSDFEMFSTWETVCPECGNPLICSGKPEGFVVCETCHAKIIVE